MSNSSVKNKLGLITLIITPLAIVIMLIVILFKRGLFAVVSRQITNYRNRKH